MSFSLLPFLFLGLSFLSLWVRREPRIWGSFFCLSLLFGLFGGFVDWIGLFWILGSLLLWIFYKQAPTKWLFFLLILVGLFFKLHLLPGYTPYVFTPKFAVSLENPLFGLFPLAFVVPLIKSKQDLKQGINGVFLGVGGIFLLAVIAFFAGVAHFNVKMPSFAAERILSNLFLTSIPEEGFYRGFLQNALSKYFGKIRGANLFSLLLTSILFTAAHLYWSPNLTIFLFVFLASLLYGGVYLFSQKIESAILTHFFLNLTHMIFFSYHAL